jgi:hypothetical protein
MRDACGTCGAPFLMPRSDVGSTRDMGRFDKQLRCNRCGQPLSAPVGSHTEQAAPPTAAVLALMRSSVHALQEQWCVNLGAPIYAIAWFSGLRHLVNIGLRPRSRVTIEAALRGQSPLACRLARHAVRGCVFERLRLAERGAVMEVVAALLEGWPTRFAQVIRGTGLAASNIDTRMERLPFWLRAPLEELAYRRWHKLTEEELFCAMRWVLKTRGRLQKGWVAQLLGVSWVPTRLGAAYAAYARVLTG